MPSSCLWILVLAAGAAAQSADVVQPIQGEPVEGKVRSIDGAGKVLIEVGGAPASRDLSDLRSIDLRIAAGAPMASQGFITLRSGMRIPAVIRECSGRQITFESPLIEGRNTIALSHVQAIRFARLESGDDGGFGKYLNEPKDDKDLIYFKTSDKIVQRSVRVVEFTGDGMVYEVRDNLQRRKVDDLYGVVMAKASGFAPDALPRPRVSLGTEGGTTLTGRLLALDGEHAVLELAEKLTLKVLRQRLRRITVASERMVYLTELDPKVEQVAAFRTSKPWMKNRTALGEGIMLGGREPRTTANGLMLPPKTSLTYDLGGQFDFFVATIGIDARSTGPAHAIFRVRDGKKVLFESGPITRQSEPIPIRVPVEKVQRLTIESDFGKNFDFGDHCVFAEARVEKRGS